MKDLQQKICSFINTQKFTKDWVSPLEKNLVTQLQYVIPNKSTYLKYLLKKEIEQEPKSFYRLKFAIRDFFFPFFDLPNERNALPIYRVPKSFISLYSITFYHLLPTCVAKLQGVWYPLRKKDVVLCLHVKKLSVRATTFLF